MGDQSLDLVVVVADNNMESTLATLLAKRRESLGIRDIRWKRIVLRFDSSCLQKAPEFLRSYVRTSGHALVLFDRDGCGREDLAREEIERSVEEQLTRAGWDDRARVVVLDPELEVWVWSDSPHVAAVLGWDAGGESVREWLKSKGYAFHDNGKPERPKEAMEAALRHAPKNRSSARYAELARKVSLKQCSDPAFLKLKQTLQTWFPPSA